MTRQGSAPFGAVALDELDRAILRLLREDGRRSNAAIARAVGVSQPTVRQRIDRLVDGGVAYVTVRINPAALGYPVDAVINIKVSGRNLRDVGEQIAAMENVSYVGYLSGAHDIQVEVFLRDNDDLFRFVTEELMPIEGVASVETSMVMRTEKFNYKWEGEAIGSTTEPATGDPAEYTARRRLKVAGEEGAGGAT
ncbi:MAG: Lrp/AsnC family transcriptional regulator [Thermoleophilia bacterium]|jgi:Lrp/AsnC family transcriptional regulator for asnA, asnC and gidA|nr:Lrp/AsnC family transcriptional regulator [Thermoleophilia bacterium]